MKICFISHSSYLGGAERALLEAIKALGKKGTTCNVVVPYDGPLCEELKRIHVPYRVVKYRPWVSNKKQSCWARTRDLLISLAMVIPLSAAVIRWRSTHVYTNTMYIFSGAVAAFLTRRPHIWHIHEFGFADHGFKFLYGKKPSLRLMDWLSTLVITNSKAVADAYAQDIPPSKIKVAYQSVSMSSPPEGRKATDTFWCVIVGALSVGKRQDDAIKAIAVLVNKGLKVGLYVIGDGGQDYASHLTQITQEFNVEKNVQFLGHRDDAFEYMSMSDVVLMCSRSEAFGRVTIEGMLAEKPVIGSRSGATPELIQDGITGLLYEPGDFEQLAQRIEYLYANPDEASLMGQRAREWALKHFGQERYGEDLLRLVAGIPGPCRELGCEKIS